MGRFRKEKGIFSVIKIFQSTKINYNLTIAGDNVNLIKVNKNFKTLEKINSQKKLLNYTMTIVFLYYPPIQKVPQKS